MKTPPTRAISCLEPLEARIAPATIFAIRSGNELISFDSATPTSLSASTLSGLVAGEKIRGLDFRPATGDLYALGITNSAGSDTGRLYKIEGSTAILIGPGPFSTTLPDVSGYGFDFNPGSDVISLTTRSLNMRIFPDTGTASTDTSTGLSVLYGAAYDHNTDDASPPTLFALDFASDALVRVGSVGGTPNSPSGGAVTVVGQLGVVPNSLEGGFDIEARTGIAYATFSTHTETSLYTINLTTGAATLVGEIGNNTLLSAMAVALPNDLTISADKKTATYIDIDGDFVTLKSPTGNFQPGDFTFAVGEKGSRLDVLDISLASRGTAFEKASLTLTATPKAGQGDSFANVGFINATGIDLGSVSINGDITKIIAGNANTDRKSPGLASLTVQSMGAFDRSTPQSLITGPVGKFTVKSDIDGATLRVSSGGIGALTIGGDLRGGGDDFNGLIEASGDIGSVSIRGSIIGASFDHNGAIESGGNIGKVFVGGSIRCGIPGFLGGSISAAGNIGAITISTDIGGFITAGGNIASLFVGGSVRGSSNSDGGGFVSAGGTLGNVTIVGSLIGEAGDESGRIQSGGNMGAVKIGGNIRGGAGVDSGTLHSDRNIASITIGGSVIGGSALFAGTISANNATAGGNPTIGAVKISGNLEGGGGYRAGSIFADSFIASVTIGGSVTSTGVYGETGSIIVDTILGLGETRGLGPVKIGRDLSGGISGTSGTIATSGSIASVTIGGDLTGGGFQDHNGIVAGGKIGAVKIGGSVSSDRATGIFIQARGLPGTPLAIASVTVGGDVTGLNILAGYDYNIALGGQVADTQIGPVTVGGNWLGGSIAAGVNAHNGIFGDADDTVITSGGNSPAIFSKIASITIKGFVFSEFNAGGFVAEEIGKLKIGTATIPLTTGPSTDLTPLFLGINGIFRVREV